MLLAHIPKGCRGTQHQQDVNTQNYRCNGYNEESRAGVLNFRIQCVVKRMRLLYRFHMLHVKW